MTSETKRIHESGELAIFDTRPSQKLRLTAAVAFSICNILVARLTNQQHQHQLQLQHTHSLIQTQAEDEAIDVIVDGTRLAEI